MAIDTRHLRLIAYEPRHLLALLESVERFEEVFGRRAGEGLRSFVVSDDVSPEWVAGLRESTGADPWAHGFALVEAATDTVVGKLGFTGPPDANGLVEMAYAVVPSREGRGYATEAAAAGIDFALSGGLVRTVRAHTAPASNASTRVLEKCGFRRTGKIDHPDDGPIWRWERAEPGAAELSAAEAYENRFVPALFGEWAEPVAQAARIASGQRVIDVACGTGVLARRAAELVSPSGAVTGLDPTPGMLAVARRRAPRIAWRQGAAESLPFLDGSFDAAVSQFGLMFFSDRRAAVREMRRVVVPGGRVAVAVWDGLEAMPAYAAEVALLERVAGPVAADALRAPFVLGDRFALQRLFENAGWTGVRIETRGGTARFPSLRAMVEADLLGWLPVMGVNLTAHTVKAVLTAAEEELRPHVVEGEGIEFPTSAQIVSAAKSPRPD